MQPVISVQNLSKTYAGGFQALKNINLDIQRGEIFALLGPNGAGKTTLIGIVCGIVNPSAGAVDGRRPRHHQRLPRRALADRAGAAGIAHRRLRKRVGDGVVRARPVRQAAHARGYIEKVLKALSLWDKKDDKIMTLSGGMKRRVLIAKALSHEPQILFLDEPTAGVDVELRKDMWDVVRELRAAGVTIILTTHYIEEAEEMADRIGVINKGEIILVEREGRTDAQARQASSSSCISPRSSTPCRPSFPRTIWRWPTAAATWSSPMTRRPSAPASPRCSRALNNADIRFRDLRTEQSSLEDIFVGLVSDRK